MNRRHLIGMLVTLTVLAWYPAQSLAQGTDQLIEPDEPVEAKFVGVSGGAIAGAELVIAAQALLGVKKTWAYLTFPVLGAAGGGVGGYFLEQQSAQGAVGLLVGSMALLIPTALLYSSATAYNPEDEEGVLVESYEDGEFSFEITPSAASTSTDETTTEVENRPSAIPGGGAGPVQPEPAAPADEAAPPAEGGESPGARLNRSDSPHQVASGRKVTYTVQRPRHSPPKLKRAAPPLPSAVVRVSSEGDARLAMPAVALRPRRLSKDEAVSGLKPGLEVFVPLLHVDLP